MFVRKSIYHILIVFFICYPVSLYANVEDIAKASLSEYTNKIIALLRDPEWQTALGQEELYKKLREIIRESFDFQAMSAQVIGKKWKEFSEEEQIAFVNAFATLLEYTYSEPFKKYQGEELVIESSRSNASGTQVEVLSSIIKKDGTKSSMIYRMHKKDSSWKVYNVIVENINLIASYRGQIEVLLQKESPASIIAIIENRSDEMKKKQAAKL
ncbi:MAG: MlaC/ttg2D family ABC transporter substrate-binding protein [Desulfovibrionaceae bacterium]